MRYRLICSLSLLCLALYSGSPARAAHAYAMWGEPALPAGFDHLPYVNPGAPKGGELRLVSNLRASTFDKYNPFTIRGNAPAYLSALMFDTLLSGSLAETATGYGLLAEDVAVAPDGLSATFRLRPEARFHNGKPVLAMDVKHSFDTLVGPYTSPAYKTMLIEVAGVDVLDERTVRYRFHKPNRELPLTVGGLPVFSRDWGLGEDGKPKPFDQVVMDIPIGSGPYRIGPVNFGKDITYVRDPQYWARDLPVRRGTANFDRVLIKIYKDNTARLEALKAGEFDLMRFFSAGDWARRVNGKKFDTGELVKAEFPNKLPTGFQSYVLNTRRPLLADRRVREALGLAFDFEWMSRQLFYGAYQRVHGIFGNTMCETHGNPTPAELALLEPWRKELPPEVFGPMYEPPVTKDAMALREHLRRALALLREAGWEVRDGVLRNARGEPFVLEYMDSSEGGVRTLSSWQRNLAKLGITLRFRSVDFALYQQRLQKFDFDITTIAYQGTNNPGQEFADLFGSQAADQEDSGNFPGVKNPAVDAAIRAMVSARTLDQVLPACHALDRIIAHEHYLIPQWSAPTHRMVYNAWRLARPQVVPPYSPGEMWVVDTWWAQKP
ncbi:ABC transporter substrate-binding protein [Alicycliphilus denitrificans]|uniref:ABC transporter substrate-binding protein n=1 Tax=Alicycliphilus denitrificans TaxID=179636 RepID=A0A858ZSJ3_9BURK|nr:extracellular solute-binding protein [Alicycliphilus denitrificans]ADV00413.1 extracellular solute-binding protein family 5 [Alicycliphilus denitrificans BC]QKD43808.1 ABC transporter substrate-binding protein [Alicycliphilus denitrificans]GAO22854.1 ABC transporter substrate-binding protein [Alicycliphilus sp. B1]